jgi:hypothetical protein
MDIPKFKELINNRVDKEIKTLNEEKEKYKKTTQFLYEEIIKELSNELDENLKSYNKILEEYYNDVQMHLYYGNSLQKKYEYSDKSKIVILFERKNMEEPSWCTPITNYDYFGICFTRVPGVEKKYKFSSNYFFSIYHAEWLEDNTELGINENNKEKILNELRSQFSQFLDLYISRSKKLKEGLKNK